MRLRPLRPSTLLALLAAAACAACPAAFASGSPGGAAAPAGGSAASTAPKVAPSAIATWFGPGFYGQKTACGQTLTPHVVGVANRTLPCGTLIKVRYKTQVIVLPVLDRGPYSSIGADWDLTAGAAHALGITETVRIRTRVVGSTPNTPTLGLAVPQPAASATSTSTSSAAATKTGGAVAG